MEHQPVKCAGHSEWLSFPRERMNEAEAGPRLEAGGIPVYEGGRKGGRKGRAQTGASTILGLKGFKKDRQSAVSTMAERSLVVLVAKNPPANAGDMRHVGLIPGSGRSLGEGNGNPLQYSCLENPMDRGAWRATVHSVAELDVTEVTDTHTRGP